MTKIKDLVTVLLDNAVLLNPIDEERYELLVQVRDFVQDYSCSEGNALVLSGKRVNDWISASNKSIFHGAEAVRVVQFHPEEARPVDLDRCRRLSAALEATWHGSPILLEDHADDVRCLVCLVWQVVLARMCESPVFNRACHPSDWRSSI